MMKLMPSYDTKIFTEVYDSADKFVYDYKHAGIPATISDANATTLYYLIYARYGNSPIANMDITQFKYKLFSIIFQYGPTWEKRLSVQQTLRDMNLADLLTNGELSDLFTHEGEDSSTETGSGNSVRNAEESSSNNTISEIAHTGTVDNTGTNSQSTDHNSDVANNGQFEDIKNHAMNPNTAPATNAYSALGYINDQVANKNTSSGGQTVDETTDTQGSTSATTTYNNTDTNTSDSDNSSTARITDSNNSNSSRLGSNSSTNTFNRTMTQGKLNAYAKLLELLKTDVTGEFINKFKVCFKQFVLPEHNWIYFTDEEDD